MASNPNYSDVTPAIEALARRSLENSSIAADDYVRYDVKRGLRDLNGKGVLAGLTEISDIVSKKMVDGEEIPCEGELYYRGYNIQDLVGSALREKRFGFEETLTCFSSVSSPRRRSSPPFPPSSPTTARFQKTLSGTSFSSPPPRI